MNICIKPPPCFISCRERKLRKLHYKHLQQESLCGLPSLCCLWRSRGESGHAVYKFPRSSGVEENLLLLGCLGISLGSRTRPLHSSLAGSATALLAWGMESGGSPSSTAWVKGKPSLSLQTLLPLLPDPSSCYWIVAERVAIDFTYHLHTDLWLGSSGKQRASVLSCPSGSPCLERYKDTHTAIGSMPGLSEGFRKYLLNGQERMTTREIQR